MGNWWLAGRSRAARQPSLAGTAASLSRNPAAARLAKLADSGRTGVLHMSGELGGHIHLAEGAVVAADCRGTPDLGTRLARAADHPYQGLLRSVWGDWLAAETIIDAAVELLSGKPGHARFRASEPPASSLGGLSAAAMLAEVSRRQRILQQLAVLLSPDTAVRRNLHLGSGAVHVSAAQWTLLMHAADSITPRDLALELGQSVFGTAVEIFHLVSLGLLSIADRPGPQAHPDNGRGDGGHRLSFLRAVIG